MNTAIAKKKVQDFIKNFSGDSNRLALSGSPFQDVSIQELLQQIKGYQKAKTKLPTWANTDGIIYPPTLHIEQTSSEITAQYKASLVQGNTLADLTGGLGVDSYYFSKKIKNIYYFELNTNLFHIAQYNFKTLKASTINCQNQDGVIKALQQQFDVIYIDPSRRNKTKGKVFFLKDCEPNLPKIIHKLILQAKVLLVKTSPMLDISAGIKELSFAHTIHIVSVQNEVKELLWELKNETVTDVKIKTVNFLKNTLQKFDFKRNDIASVLYGKPKKYLYEPNPAILKSGGFDLLSEQFDIEKLHQNSHLFTSNKIVDFPGRCFIIKQVIPYKKKVVKQFINNSKATISTRNFPETVAQLRKKWNIKDGGSSYLFFTTLQKNEKVVLLCEKISS